MRKIGLNEIKHEIEVAFPQSDLSAEVSDVCSNRHLRFELGLGFENGTVDRVNQAVARATTIFEIFFKHDDDVWIIANSFHCRGNVTEFFKSSSGYFEGQFSNWDVIDKLETEKTIEEFDDALNEEGVMERTDFSTTYRQIIFCEELRNINYQNILRGIANLEMGMEPSISTKVQFVNIRNGVAFYMYDDRGCLVYANDRETLRPIYRKYNHWLVDSYRQEFDALFS